MQKSVGWYSLSPNIRQRQKHQYSRPFLRRFLECGNEKSRDYTAHPTPPHPRTSQNRATVSLSQPEQCYSESHAQIPLSNNGFVSVSDATQNQSQMQLFLIREADWLLRRRILLNTLTKLAGGQTNECRQALVWSRWALQSCDTRTALGWSHCRGVTLHNGFPLLFSQDYFLWHLCCSGGDMERERSCSIFVNPSYPELYLSIHSLILLVQRTHNQSVFLIEQSENRIMRTETCQSIS